MSRETIQWLNTNTLIGFTDKRGNAWHYDAAAQGDQPNHYTGPVPIGDVRTRLFGWEAVSRPVLVALPSDVESADSMADDGTPIRYDRVPGSQAICRSDSGAVLGIFKDGYQPHQYGPTLLDGLSNILDDGLSIGSAGLLRGGAVAWVSVEVPDTITTPEGVAFRPNLLAATSFDGSLATTYKRVVTNTVCDNTMSAALREDSPTYRVKHTRNSQLRLSDAREALGIIHSISDDFAAQVKELCEMKVNRLQFRQFIDAVAPAVDDTGQPLTGRGLTLATVKRDRLTDMWNHDARVTPWAGTGYGVVQLMNTWEHWDKAVRGADGGRAERNMLRAVTGEVDALDYSTLAVLRDGVLAAS
jgi:phage/plasmid-like protein (TIGR03299 family)